MARPLLSFERMNTLQQQRSRRVHSRAGVSWTAWVTSGSRRVRCHTVDLSANGAKLRPRGEMQPGTPVEVQFHPPEGSPVHVSAVVWRVDPDAMALFFLKSIPVQATGSKSWQENGRRGWR
jgi:hypothetical protein